MGVSERFYEGPLMTASEIASFLLRRCSSLRDFRSYLFGSSLKGVGVDIDILVVGPSDECLSRLKQELAAVSKELPIDVIYMDPSEALETNFISNEGCVALTHLVTKQAPTAHEAPEY